MKRYLLNSMLAAALVVLPSNHSWAQVASFEGLGFLPGGGYASVAWGVSADGSTVVGYGVRSSGTEAFRWTAMDGMMGLGDLPGGNSYSEAHSVSADGSSVVGRSFGSSGWEAFRWTAADGMMGLGDLPGGAFSSEAYGISADGSTVVGNSSGSSGGEAFRWTAMDGMMGLGDLPGGQYRSSAQGVSADGSTVAGYSISNSGWEAFRWSAVDGMRGLGDLPGGGFLSWALGISADGSTVVGYSITSSGDEAFRWTAVDGMIGLGNLLGGNSNSFADDVSGNGFTIVGWSASNLGSVACVWDPVHGIRSLKTILESDYGLDLTGWLLTQATGVSEDGRVMVGRGMNPQGRAEAWRAVLGPVNTGPDVTCPEGVAAECVNGGASILVAAEVFDADGDPLAIEWAVTYPDGSVTTIADTVTFDNPPAPIPIALASEGFFFPHGNSSVQLHVTDGIAETHACSPVTITVADTAGPVIVTLMELIEVGNDPGTCFATVDLSPGSEYAPVFSDLCSPDVTATNNAPETFPLGETIVTWTVNDGHGNTTTATQTVVVYDREAPMATAPADIVVPHDPGYPVATLASLGTPAASDNCGVTNISNDAPEVFPLGPTEVKWYVSDAAGNTTIVTQRVEVTNASPVADAGLSQILECTSAAGVQYTLNGTASFDPDAGDTELLTFQWSAVDGVGDPIVFDNPDSATPTATFPLGSTTVTLTVTDICGDTTSDYVIIAVDDTQAPVIEVMITDRDILQVPNHNMVPVNLRLLVRDTCELPELLQVTCVAASSEPDDGRGDGSFTGDVNGADGYTAAVPVSLSFNADSGYWEGTLNLRSERDGAEDGRKYALICTVMDDSGNSSTATACIVVPHDRRRK